MLYQVGQFASSKSAMKVDAPQLSALITILRSVGPVISTRRSSMSFGCGAIGPVALADGLRLGQEVGQLAGVELLLPRGARGEQFLAARLERAMQLRDERERLGREDFGECRGDLAGDLDAGGQRGRSGGVHDGSCEGGNGDGLVRQDTRRTNMRHFKLQSSISQYERISGL